MGFNKKYGVARATTKEQRDHMQQRKAENIYNSKYNKGELRFLGKLDILEKDKGVKFTRQAIRGTRIYDFWCHDLGVAVEIDGSSHDSRKEYDARCDKHNYEVCGIRVLRVPIFDEITANDIIDEIKKETTWAERRIMLGLKVTETQKEKIKHKEVEDKKFFSWMNSFSKK